MEDILDEASSVIQCKECSWYKSCVLPMRLSADDLTKQMQSSLAGGGMVSEELLSALASSAQAMILEGCPIFVKRLRANPRMAEQIKKLMQGWSNAPQG
ncbi:MAG: hypothetical protein HW414_1110 [Dehalococcoidia bacterium]|nr:hypothetical protein [Dehalococcoidia bacterium]